MLCCGVQYYSTMYGVFRSMYVFILCMYGVQYYLEPTIEDTPC